MRRPGWLLLSAVFVSAAAAQYDHLTIAPDSLIPPLAPVCARVESRGLSDTTVSVAEVLVSSTGRDLPEKIRNFIKRAYSEWGTTHVLLAGDNEQIPCRLCWCELTPQYRDWIPTELYYSALDGDWDGDGDGRFGEPEDSVDLIPDVLLGRLPLATPAEMVAFADRFLAYTSDSTAPYLENVLFAGFDYSNEYHSEAACELLDTLLRPPSMSAFKVYDSHAGNHEDSVRHLLDRGMNVWVQFDHCTNSIVGSGWLRHNWFITSDELDDMANAPNYTIGVAGGCFVSAFDSSCCVAEVLLTAPAGGCVATFGSTRLTWGTDPDPFRTGTHFYCEQSLEGFWPEAGHGSLAGLVVGQARAAPLVPENAVWRWCHYEYMLAGEPSMPVWMPSPTGVVEPVRPSGWTDAAGLASHVRGSLAVPGRERLLLTDASGRDVMRLEPGLNRLAGIPAGVYFLRSADRPGRLKGRVVKVSQE